MRNIVAFWLSIAVLSGCANPGIYAELIKLDVLRKRGILTAAEFEAQKKKLLETK